MSTILIAICIIACSALAFSGGVAYERAVIRVRLELFHRSYYPLLMANQHDASKERYCAGAIDMYKGLVSEMGLQVVDKDSSGTTNKKEDEKP